VKLTRPGPGTVIFAAALLLRAGWVLLRWVKAGPGFEFPDEGLHWQLAANLVGDGALISDDGRYAARMPGYPLFLALFAWLGETGVLFARLAQALLGAATAWIAYTFAYKALGRRAALIAGGLICIDPYGVFFANLLLTESLFGLLAVGLTACAWSLLTDARQPARAATLGVALLGAAALMTRPSAAGWIALLWVLLWLFDAQRSRATRRLTLNLALLAVCLLAWGLRNRAVIGAPAWLSTNGGITLYDAQGPQANGGSNQTFLNELPRLAGLSEVERDRELRRLAIEQMRADPARVARLAWAKFLRTWNLTPNVADYRGGVTGLVSAVFTAAILLLAFIGVNRALRRRDRPALDIRPHRRLQMLLWLPVLYFTLLHCVFVGSLRYRVPLMPFLEIAAATALVPGNAKRPELT
jgi:4-amino-4-deoxy-L-arabinose transferase-like glycosyltransferase